MKRNNSPEDVFEFLEFPDPKASPKPKQTVIPEIAVDMNLEKEKFRLEQKVFSYENEIAQLLVELNDTKAQFATKSDELERQGIRKKFSHRECKFKSRTCKQSSATCRAGEIVAFVKNESLF